MNQPRQDETSTATARPRRHFLSYKRRWVIWGLILLLIALMVIYNTLTQDHRVRAFVERELGRILGGPVSVEHARFTLARGLEVRGVSVSVDTEGRDDSQLLYAGELNVDLDFSRISRFRVDLKRIEAKQVRVQIVEDLSDNSWNFQRLLPGDEGPQQDDEPREAPEAPSVVPAVAIDDAVISFSRRINGRLEPVGDVKVDVDIVPTGDNEYGFKVVSDPSVGREVRLIGSFDGNSDQISGRLTELNIDHALREMLPSRLRDALSIYDFTGRFSVPSFRYSFARADRPEDFELKIRYEDARCTVQPRQWLSRREIWRMDLVKEHINLLRMMGMNKRIPRDRLTADSDADVMPLDLVSYLRVETRPIPLYLTNVSGMTTLTGDGIKVEAEMRLQGQQLVLRGELKGYSATAAGQLSIQTKPGTYIQIPPSQQFMAWLPDDVRRAYLQFKPRGKGRIGINLTRATPGGPFDPVVVVDLFESQLEFEDFPYPLQNCTGQFIFSHDSEKDVDLLRIQQLRGNGVAGGPNANSVVEINGIIGPFEKGGPGIDVHVSGSNISSEPILRERFPRDVANAVNLFGPPDYGHRLAATGAKEIELSGEEAHAWPQFSGDFDVWVKRDAGWYKRVDTHVQLRLKSATGTLKIFPYPMHNISAVVDIYNDHLEIRDLRMNHNGATLELDGSVGFAQPVSPDIRVDARNVAIDDDLLDALPPTEREWIKRLALEGRVDINGRVFLAEGSTSEHARVDFDLNIRAHDAMLMRDANGPAFTAINGDLFLEPARLQFADVTGRRGNATLVATGEIDWKDGTPDIDLKLDAADLLLEKTLRDILPEAVQQAWDQHRPDGTTDLSLHYVMTTPPADGSAIATTRPVDKIDLTLRPRQLSAFSDVFPYRVDNLKGQIVVRDNHVRLIDLTGEHGKAQFKVNAEGVTAPVMDFKLQVSATNVEPDEDLKVALPVAVADVIDGLAAEGAFEIRFDKLHVRGSPEPLKRIQPPPAASKRRPATRPARAMKTPPLDVDFECVISSAGSGKLDIGLPVSEIYGWTRLSGEVRENFLTRLEGSITADSYSLMGRKGGNLTATLRRPDYSSGLLLQQIRTELAGGSMAGDVTILSHDNSPSQYAVQAVIQHADLAQVLGQNGKEAMEGSVTGSFDVEGIFGDTRNRRGRGRIQISGNDMYEAPIILGFFRLVNFALPLRDGVNDIDVSYTLMGEQATFDRIQLSAPGLNIYGDGVLDFARKEIDLTLNTENPDSWRMPLIEPLIKRAREELLQIRIKGTLEEPKVQAMPLPTFQATLDRVVQDVKQPRR